MFKKSILFSFALLFTTISFGQKFKINKVKKLITSGNLNPDIGYLFYENKKSGINFKSYTLGFLKNGAKNLSPNITVAVETGDYFMSCLAGKEQLFLWFYSSENFQNKIFICNPSSKKSENIEFSSDRDLPIKAELSEKNLILLYQSWNNKERFVLKGYNSSFVKQWDYFELEENPVVGFFTDKERVFVVTQTDKNNRLVQSFTEVDASTGKPVSNYTLPNSQGYQNLTILDVFIHPSGNPVCGLFFSQGETEKVQQYFLYNFGSQTNIGFLPSPGAKLPNMISRGIYKTEKGYLWLAENYEIEIMPKNKIVRNRFKEIQYRELANQQKELNLIDRKIQNLMREKDASTAPETSDPNAAMERIMKIETEIQILQQQKDEEQRKLNLEKAKIDALPSESDTINYNEYSLHLNQLFWGELDYTDRLINSGNIFKTAHESYQTNDFPNSQFTPDNFELSVTKISQLNYSPGDILSVFFNKEKLKIEVIYNDAGLKQHKLSKADFISYSNPEVTVIQEAEPGSFAGIINFSDNWILLKTSSTHEIIEVFENAR